MGGGIRKGSGAGEDQKKVIPVTWLLEGETSPRGVTEGSC